MASTSSCWFGVGREGDVGEFALGQVLPVAVAAELGSLLDPEWDVEMIARMAQRAGLPQCALGSKILQVSRCGRPRGAGDADVFLGTEAAFEPIDAFSEHAGDGFILAVVQLAAQPPMQSRLGNAKIDAPDGIALCCKDRVAESGDAM